MRGKIKFFVTEKGWGKIAVDGQAEVFFHISNAKDANLRCIEGEPVEFDAIESKKVQGTLEAHNVRLASGFKHEEFRLRGHPSTYLFQWGYTQLDDFQEASGNVVRGVLHDLAEIALDEDWSYGDADVTRTPLPILRSYLINTFFKLYRDGGVREVSFGGRNWASFNTGLVDDRYDPIFAFMSRMIAHLGLGSFMRSADPT